jgi:hypothetical protein
MQAKIKFFIISLCYFESYVVGVPLKRTSEIVQIA